MSRNGIIQAFYERLLVPYRIYKKLNLYDNEIFQWMLLSFASGMDVKDYQNGRDSVKISFVIPHYNASKFCSWAVKSIVKTSSKIDSYEILIADAGSDPDEKAQLMTYLKSLEGVPYRFYIARVRRSHPFLLEFLLRESKGKYVITLDQDSIILSEKLDLLISEIEIRKNLIAIGIRDYCEHRWAYDMVHPSFILLHKTRLKRRVKELIYFSGRKPMIETFRLGPNSMEPYYSLVCKIKKYVGMEAVDYLGTYKTSYLYGTVGYWKNLKNPVVFHKWYSGRIKNYSDDDLVDGRPVAPVKADLVKFENDLLNGKLDLEPVEVFC